MQLEAGGWTFQTTDLGGDAVASVAVGNAATVTLDGFAGVTIPGKVTRIAMLGTDRQGDVVFTVVVTPTGAVLNAVRWNMKASVEISIQ